MANSLPLSNIINVTITTTPQGISARNVNRLALFTTDEPDNINPYGIYVSAAQVAADYGTDSETASMANAIFAQNPNILSGSGGLVIIPLGQDTAGNVAISATSGDLTTANLSSTLASILLVSNGDVKITIDGVAYNLRGLNFTLATTWADIAAILQAELIAATVEAVTNGFKITSKKVGTSSTVAMAAVSGGTGTDLNGSGYFKGASATANAGANSDGETIEEAITRTSAEVFYCGIISNLLMEDSVVENLADFIQARDFIYLNSTASIHDIAGLATDIVEAGDTKMRILLHSNSLSAANLMKCAYAGHGFSTNFSGSNTASTMNLKQLATIDPDTEITQTVYNQAEDAGVDLYVSYQGSPGVFSTGANDYFDNVYANLALKFALEEAGFNFLAQTNTKIPQTENGMNGLKSAYAQVMETFVRDGTIAPGTWTSSETFGDPQTFRQNILDKGYYIYSIPVSQQDPIERAERKAPLVQIAIKLAGAIHTSDVIVVINP
jgi:hypothetical protein